MTPSLANPERDIVEQVSNWLRHNYVSKDDEYYPDKIQFYDMVYDANKLIQSLRAQLVEKEKELLKTQEICIGRGNRLIAAKEALITIANVGSGLAQQTALECLRENAISLPAEGESNG